MMLERNKFRLVDAALSGDVDAQRAVAQSTTLQGEAASLKQIRDLLREYHADIQADSFLEGRVVRRLTSRSYYRQSLYYSLAGIFRPVAVGALMLIASMAAYNMSQRSAYESTPTTAEIMLGLQPVTLTEAYAADLGEFIPVTP